MRNKILLGIASFAVVSLAFFAVLSLAANASSGKSEIKHSGNTMTMRVTLGVVGTVTAINGNTITLAGSYGLGRQEFYPKPTPTATPALTTYTINVTGSTKIMKNGVAGTISSILVGDRIIVQGTVSGTTVTATSINDGIAMNKLTIMGTITAIDVGGNVNMFTVNGNPGFRMMNEPSVTPTPTPTTASYTVDATNAKVTKSGTASTVSAIAVGDSVMIQGAINGTSVVATSIRDGVSANPGKHLGWATAPGQSPITLPITGNGQPVIAGTISAINGSTLTVTNKSNVTYSVDAASAKIVQGQNTITISGVSVGDPVLVQGTVNGTSVVASSVIDQHMPTPTVSTTPQPGSHPKMGIFGRIGNFFRNIFGF